ncbi:MAG: fused MFS/spermidine synthase [Gammaproteobacteria bacterium]|nr:fused MFS/spermidine synthase [Gammaproteobacteria bacterium]
MTEARRSKLLFAYLLFSALVCGAAVMVIEVLGSRVIGPFFGVSLFVWTSLISVTMIALALGYWFGGVLADRRGQSVDLYALIAAAGICVLLIPWLKAPVLEACLPLGLRTGAFASSMILFGPALLLLGSVSPYLVKIAARAVDNIGRTVGGLYALSTIGSVAGTALTGFFMIAYLGVNQAFYAVGFTLLLLAAAYFAALRRLVIAGAALVLCLVLAPQWIVPPALSMPDAQVREVFSGDTFYGSVKVVDVDYGDAVDRQLLIDGLHQGGQDLQRRLTVNRYPYLMQYIPYRLQPNGRDCLVVGLGAGFIPGWYSARGIRTDVVDIDPLIPQLARDYFGFTTNGDVIEADARHFLLTSARMYDYIVLDAYNGDLMPYHLLSREMFSLIAQHLRPGGVLGVNFIGSIGAQRRMTSSVVRTLRSVFESVDVYPVFDVTDLEGGVGNLEIFAYNGKRNMLPLGEVPGIDIHPRVNAQVRSFLRSSYPLPVDADALVLTDDYNPMDFFDAGLRETVRGWLLQSTARGLLTR